MIKNLKPLSELLIMRRSLILVLGGWALVATVLVVRLKPAVVLIGIDQYGTRVITNEDDRLLKSERENFIKKYIAYSFSYSSADFDQRTSAAGDMMTAELWERKKFDLGKISENLKANELTQVTRIQEMRELGDNQYEADLEIKVKNKLQEGTAKIRVELKLQKAPRTNEKPYQYEVSSHVENTLS
jgi:hypothetical protein